MTAASTRKPKAQRARNAPVERRRPSRIEMDGDLYIGPFAPFYCVLLTDEAPDPEPSEAWAIWDDVSPRCAAETFVREALGHDSGTHRVEVRTPTGNHRLTVQIEERCEVEVQVYTTRSKP